MAKTTNFEYTDKENLANTKRGRNENFSFDTAPFGAVGLRFFLMFPLIIAYVYNHDAKTENYWTVVFY